MRNKKWVIGLTIFLILGLMFSASCAKKGAKQASLSDSAAADQARMEELRRQQALDEERLRDEARQREQMETEGGTSRDDFINEDIYFEFDQSTLSSEAQEILRGKASWLNSNPEAFVIIEGHCDERGTNDYNLALGDRRAQSAKRFLMDMGISGSRLETISYGEERPLDPGSNEEAWAKNRRGHFVIK
jgi:peptidoglycan-associated lipoprotein